MALPRYRASEFVIACLNAMGVEDIVTPRHLSKIAKALEALEQSGDAGLDCEFEEVKKPLD